MSQAISYRCFKILIAWINCDDKLTLKVPIKVTLKLLNFALVEDLENTSFFSSKLLIFKLMVEF